MSPAYESGVFPTPAWGTLSGALALQPASGNVSTDFSLDRILILDRVFRYAWAFDERRLDALQNCFTENAVWEGNTQGRNPVSPIHGREAICRWLATFWERQSDQRRHMMFDVVVNSQTPESAQVLVSLALTSASAGKLSIVLTSFYRLEVVKVEQRWRIAHLFEGFDIEF